MSQAVASTIHFWTTLASSWPRHVLARVYVIILMRIYLSTRAFHHTAMTSSRSKEL